MEDLLWEYIRQNRPWDYPQTQPTSTVLPTFESTLGGRNTAAPTRGGGSYLANQTPFPNPPVTFSVPNTPAVGRQDQITLDPLLMRNAPYAPWVQPLASTEPSMAGISPTPGTYQYIPQTAGTLDPRIQELRDYLIPKMYATGDEQEQIWNWQDYYSTLLGSSLGLGRFREQGAMDPLARLQAQLQNQYDPSAINKLSQPQNFSGMLTARNQGLNQQVSQRAAGMGMTNVFDPLMAEQYRSRATLANQAQAAYQPLAYQQQKALREQTDQLLQAINQAEQEQERIFAGTGVG